MTRSLKGRPYTSWQIDDYSGGTRKRWTKSTEAEARQKAQEVAEAIANGRSLFHSEEYKAEIRRSLYLLTEIDERILPATQLYVQAVRILGGKKDDLLAACQHWMAHRLKTGNYDPAQAKTVKEAATAYLDHSKKRISPRRHRNQLSSFRYLVEQVGEEKLNNVTAAELTDLIEQKNWGARRRVMASLFPRTRQNHTARELRITLPFETSAGAPVSFFNRLGKPSILVSSRPRRCRTPARPPRQFPPDPQPISRWK